MVFPTLQWIVVGPEVAAALRTAEDIRQQLDPTPGQHFAERLAGWTGSDGSSNSPDTIWGLRIGRSTTDFAGELPTWCHDLDYHVIRRLWACGAIDEAEAEKLRRAADEALMIRLLRVIEDAWWILRPLRRRRALKYYEGVRLGGKRHVRPNPFELYPRLP